MSIGSQREELRGPPQRNPFTTLPFLLQTAGRGKYRHAPSGTLSPFQPPSYRCSTSLGLSAQVAQSPRPKTWLRQSPIMEAMMGHQGGQYSMGTSKGAARWQCRAAGRVQTDPGQKFPDSQKSLCAWVRNSVKLSGAGRSILTNVECGGGVQLLTWCGVLAKLHC